MKRIAILLHEGDVRQHVERYLIWACRTAWEEQGDEVVVVRGVDRPVPADVLVSHVNLTVVPDDYVRFQSQYSLVVNRGVGDISKTAISDQLLLPGDGYDGPVIVKTDRNYGGRPERRLLSRPRGLRHAVSVITGDLNQRLARHSARLGSVGLAWADTLFPERYPIFPSMARVPRAVFDNEALVVERFLPEMEDGLYCLRSYCFLGDRSVTVRVKSPDPVVKAGSVVDREEVAVADGIVAARHSLDLDYGKLDYVVHQGEVVLLDANRTPTLGRSGFDEAQRRTVRRLAEGITSFERA